jgi:hypothetical protein
MNRGIPVSAPSAEAIAVLGGYPARLAGKPGEIDSAVRHSVPPPMPA